MIYIERKIVIKKDIAQIEEPILLYKGDKNIELQFFIENNPFKYKSGAIIPYGQLVIKRPNTAPIFSEPAKLSNNKVIFIITDGMIDESVELGNYDFQIRLINDDKTARATLPPVASGIVIMDPVCEEAAANIATVNNPRYTVLDSNEPEDAFDEDGNYNKTIWVGGDIITDTRLNKVEEALYQINDNIPTDYVTQDYVDTAIETIELTPGPQGEQGPQGIQGEIGPQGPVGPQGEPGKDGVDGADGADGQNGKDFTYDMFTPEQLEALRGPEGPQGPAGKDADPVDLTGYATEEYVNNKIVLIRNDLNDYDDALNYLDGEIDKLKASMGDIESLLGGI